MPIYEYKCLKCGKHHEVAQKMSDTPLSKCPDCRGKMKKLMSLAGFHLKGGGWYKDGYASASAKPEGKTTPSSPAPVAGATIQPAKTDSPAPPPGKEAPQAPSKKKESAT